jgi:hypothetical protein
VYEKVLNFSRKFPKNMIPVTESGIMERSAGMLDHDKSDRNRVESGGGNAREN